MINGPSTIDYVSFDRNPSRGGQRSLVKNTYNISKTIQHDVT